MAGTTITVNIEADVLHRLRALAALQKRKKGFLGKIISEAVKEYLKEIEQEDIAKRQLERMKKGYAMGKLLVKNRDELYDRK